MSVPGEAPRHLLRRHLEHPGPEGTGGNAPDNLVAYRDSKEFKVDLSEP